MLIHLDTIQIEFESQGHRSKFIVTEEKNMISDLYIVQTLSKGFLVLLEYTAKNVNSFRVCLLFIISNYTFQITRMIIN